MTPRTWSPDSWRRFEAHQQPVYRDGQALQRVTHDLAQLPPLVTSFEVERLRELLAEAQEGRRFLLQAGDCAERVEDCRAEPIAARLKILLQMSLVLTHGLRQPVIRVGRFAGQYAKPRSQASETRVVDGASLTLPSYLGDLINRPEFTAEAREPRPERLLEGYSHAALTLNFVRALVEGGFTDWHEVERWDLPFLHAAALTGPRRAQYETIKQGVASARDLQAMAEGGAEHFYASHEGLHLEYERAQTRNVPHRRGHYCLTTHLPWIGDRTRALDGAHVEFFRGIQNPVGVKLGPSATAADVRDLAQRLNPADTPGRLVFITRVGAHHVERLLPDWIEAVRDRRVLWVCDPMHGNTTRTPAGIKTRSFEAIAEEFERTLDIHNTCASHLGGLHVEVTADDVTECIGGAAGPEENGLEARYETACDPRLNYKQSLELSFRLAGHLAGRSGIPARD
ncbi:MAG: 3-deoxy-7-phosphoheptulonate synthase class II [Planctomycetota bacterium]